MYWGTVYGRVRGAVELTPHIALSMLFGNVLEMSCFYGTLGVKGSRFKFDTHSLVFSIVKLYLSAVVYLMI